MTKKNLEIQIGSADAEAAAHSFPSFKYPMTMTQQFLLMQDQ
jgi:hypothetical protein